MAETEREYDPWHFVDEDYPHVFMAATNRWNHSKQVNTTMPPEIVAAMHMLVDSKETPYKKIQDYICDALTKNALWWQKQGVMVGPVWQEYVQMMVAQGLDEWDRRQEVERTAAIESSRERLERTIGLKDRIGFMEALGRARDSLIVMKEPWASDYARMVDGFEDRAEGMEWKN